MTDGAQRVFSEKEIEAYQLGAYDVVVFLPEYLKANCFNLSDAISYIEEMRANYEKMKNIQGVPQ